MKIYNTLTRKKEEFKPIEEGKIKMYVCGPTVYNVIHIGNARPFVMFDIARRYFEYKGYEVNYVQNYTDIDDKIIKRAIEENITTEEVANKYIKEVETDVEGLGVTKATKNPKATEEIPEMIEMISLLIEKGYAYEVHGTVYFESNKFEGYGKLSKKNIDDLESGKRIAVEAGKKNPSDFVLWKPKKEGEPFWKSPWGEGRPGWHIECSCMAKKYLGDTIDIHAGGADLVFPHHENEIAQSEASNEAQFANYWMHNGFININNQKMSKSKGNFFTIRDIAKDYSYEIIRFFLLNAHYRSPINFSKELMDSAVNGLTRIRTAYNTLKEKVEKADINEKMTEQDKNMLKEFRNKFEASMDDDVNTANAVSDIYNMVKYINTSTEKANGEFIIELEKLFVELCAILGIAYKQEEVLLDSDILEMIEQRQNARKERDFAKSDEIRDKLLELGIVLEDTREGVKYKRV